MKILVIHEVGYIKKPVNEFQDFAESLSSIGHDVTVIDFNESEKGGFKESFVCRTGKSIIRLINIPNCGVPILKYFYAQIFFYLMLKRMIKKNEVDAILLYSVFINGVSTIYLGKKYRIPVIYRVLDAYHLLRESKIDSIVLKYGEKYIYKNASVLSLTNKAMASYVTSIAGKGGCANYEVLEHGVDCDHFVKMQKDSSLQAELGICDKDFVCVFLGTTYTFSRIDKLIRHFKDIKEKVPNFKLLVIGAGDIDDEISNTKVKFKCEDDVIQVGMIDYHDLPKYISLGSVGINPFEINDVTRDIIPIKVLQYQSSELPVLSTPLPDLTKLLPYGETGIHYSKTDLLEDFVNDLIKISSRSDLPLIGKQARAYVKNNHSIEKTIKNLEILIKES